MPSQLQVTSRAAMPTQHSTWSEQNTLINLTCCRLCCCCFCCLCCPCCCCCCQRIGLLNRHISGINRKISHTIVSYSIVPHVWAVCVVCQSYTEIECVIFNGFFCRNHRLEPYLFVRLVLHINCVTISGISMAICIAHTS